MKNTLRTNKCLNIGSGCKIDYDRYEQYGLTIHVDQGFNEKTSDTLDSAIQGTRFKLNGSQCPKQLCCRSSIFDFVDKFPFKFDMVFAERIFEHMEYVGGEIGRLLEGLNTLTNPNAKMEIIVPNAILISKILQDIEKNYKTMDPVVLLNSLLILNTENHNFRGDAHLSSWTPHIARLYIESEGTWEIDDIEEQVEFAGRDIYMRIHCSKI